MVLTILPPLFSLSFPPPLSSLIPVLFLYLCFVCPLFKSSSFYIILVKQLNLFISVAFIYLKKINVIEILYILLSCLIK